jgi:hypothetical protein
MLNASSANGRFSFVEVIASEKPRTRNGFPLRDLHLFLEMARRTGRLPQLAHPQKAAYDTRVFANRDADRRATRRLMLSLPKTRISYRDSLMKRRPGGPCGCQSSSAARGSIRAAEAAGTI